MELFRKSPAAPNGFAADRDGLCFGGRMPMTMTTPAGGSTHVPTVDDMANLLSRVEELQGWIDRVFIPDVLAIAPHYLEYTQLGAGPRNFLAWGVFDDDSFDSQRRLLPSGVVLDGELVPGRRHFRSTR